MDLQRAAPSASGRSRATGSVTRMTATKVTSMEEFRQRRILPAETTLDVAELALPQAHKLETAGAQQNAANGVRVEELYPAREELSSLLVPCLSLLDQATA